jgi:excisionase family DNA binding protein
MTTSKSKPAKRSSAEWYDVPGLANHLGLSEGFVRALVARREIPFAKIGKFVRFDPDEIDMWLAERRVDTMVY